MKRKSLILGILPLTLAALAGCGNNQANKWDISMEDYNQAIILPAPEYQVDYANNTIKYVFDLGTTNVLDEKALENNIIIYDRAQLGAELMDGKKLADGNSILSAKVSHKNLLITDREGTGVKDKLEVVTPYDANYKPAVIVNKEASPMGRYVIVPEIDPTDPVLNMDVKDYSKKIVEEEYDTTTGNVINFVSGAAMVIIGIIGEQPTAIVGGITTLLNTMLGIFSNSVTNEQLLEEIHIIQQQLAEVIDKLNDMQKTLEQLQIITQCGFEKTYLLQIENNWNAFIANYYDPLNKHLNNFGTTYTSYLQGYVEKSEDIELKYKAVGDDYELLGKWDAKWDNPDKTINITVPAFPETKKYLVNGVFTKKFVDGLLKDLENNAPEKDWRKKEEIAIDAYNHISNEFAREQYFSTDIQSQKYKLALDIIQGVEDFADHISGQYMGGQSILQDAYTRLTLQYNFAKEVKPVWTNFLATIKCYLTYFGQLAQTAGLAAKVSTEEMNKKIIAASNKIKAMYEETNKLPDSYSYVVGRKIEGKLGQTRCETRVTGGSENHPTIEEKFEHKLIKSVGPNPADYVEEDLDFSKYNVLGNTDIIRMSNRWYGIKGTDNPEAPFVGYLYENNVMDWNTYFKGKGGGVENMVKGFLTGLTIRDMSGGENLTCVWRSNGDYFNKGGSYTYKMERGKIESKYWKDGKVAVATMVDAENGHSTFEQTLTGYARYWESHALWFNDEIWGFKTAVPFHSYWFLHTA
mgnify:CR=1 FL=1